ncbi:T9SS type A sorting domain-containing protein, partial [candidate division TA06 bacterium]|nr:T9SS type A sorting domain-containing protein [candidate division TA06 bacterium]
SDWGYIIAGDTRSFGAGGWDFYIIKTDSLGDTLWTRTYGDTNHEASTFVQETSDGGYIVAGYTSSFGAGNGDVYLIKTDSLGDTLWTRTFGGTANDEGWSVQQTVQDGGYIIAGGTTSFGAGGKDLYLLKTDSLAATLWARTYGGTEEDHGWSVQQTVPDGGYIIAGTTRSFGAGGSDVYLIKTDGNGQVGVKEEDSRVRIPSSRVMLYHNEPNPFHHITMIHYQIPDTNHESRITKHVTLAVYDITGKQVETLVDEFQEPGVYEVEWEGKNVSSGIYFYRLQTGDFIATRKMILLK